MENSKYTIKRRIDKDKSVVYDLIRNKTVIYTSKSEYVLADILGTNNGSNFSDEVIQFNIKKDMERILQEKKNKIEQKYIRPSSFVDVLLIIFLVFQVIAFLISTPHLNNLFGSRTEPLGFFVGVILLIFTITILTSILTSRAIDRNLLDRLDEVEKKLNLYKKEPKED